MQKSLALNGNQQKLEQQLERELTRYVASADANLEAVLMAHKEIVDLHIYIAKKASITLSEVDRILNINKAKRCLTAEQQARVYELTEVYLAALQRIAYEAGEDLLDMIKR